MRTRLIALLQKPGVRYLLVGGSVYVFELIVILAAQRAGASPVQAVAVSYVLGTAVSFLLQKLVTFGDRRMHHRIVLTQLLATIALVVFNLGFTLLVTRLLSDHTYAVVSRTVALLITTIWNFYLYKTRIFKPAAEKPLMRVNG